MCQIDVSCYLVFVYLSLNISLVYWLVSKLHPPIIIIDVVVSLSPQGLWCSTGSVYKDLSRLSRLSINVIILTT